MINKERPEDQPVADETATDGVEALKDDVLGKVANMLPEGAIEKATEMLDRDGDGNVFDDLQGLASRFLNKQ